MLTRTFTGYITDPISTGHPAALEVTHSVNHIEIYGGALAH